MNEFSDTADKLWNALSRTAFNRLVTPPGAAATKALPAFIESFNAVRSTLNQAEEHFSLTVFSQIGTHQQTGILAV